MTTAMIARTRRLPLFAALVVGVGLAAAVTAPSPARASGGGDSNASSDGHVRRSDHGIPKVLAARKRGSHGGHGEDAGGHGGGHSSTILTLLGLGFLGGGHGDGHGGGHGGGLFGGGHHGADHGGHGAGHGPADAHGAGHGPADPHAAPAADHGAAAAAPVGGTAH